MADDKLKRGAVVGLAVVAAVGSINYGGLFADEVGQEPDGSISNGDGNLTKEVTPSNSTPTENNLTESDIGLIANVSSNGGIVLSDDESTMYTQGCMKVHIAASTLKEGPTIARIGLMRRTGEDVDSGVEENIEGVEGDFSLAGYKNSEYSVYTITVYLNNGQRFLFPLESITGAEFLSKITTHVEDTTPPTVEFYDASWEINNGFVNKDGEFSFKVSDPESGVESVNFYVDGERQVGDNMAYPWEWNKETGLVSVLSSNFSEGSHLIEIKAINKVNNPVNFEYELNVMREAPEISGKSYSGCVIYDGKTVYGSSMSLSFDGFANEKLASIVVKDTEGSWNKEVDMNTGTVSLSNVSGSCMVEAIDLAGNIRSYSLSQLFPELSDTLVCDMELPTCSFELVNEGKDGWLNNIDEAIVRVHFNDNLALKSAKVVVNGDLESVQDLVKVEGTDYSDVNLSAFKVPEDGRYNVSVILEDYAGNINEPLVYTVCVDTELPSVSVASYTGVLKEYEGKVYVQGELKINLNTSDKPSGVEKIELLKGEEEPVEIEDTLSVSDDGEYSIKVSDVAGNEDSKTFQELFGFSSNILVFDKSAPVVSASLNGSPENLNTWVSGTGNLVLSFTDDTILSGAEVYVNGVKQDFELSGSSDEVTIDLLANGTVNPSNGIYNIMVTAEDLLGQRTTENYVAKIDLDSPEIAGIKVDGNKKLFNGNLYASGMLTVTCNAADDKSGVKSVELVKDGQVVASGSNFVIDSDGVYSIRVTNNVDLVTEKTLADLLGSTFDKVLIDNEAPTLLATLNDEEIGEVWTVNNAILNVSLSDNVQLSSASVVVNGEEFLYPLNSDKQSFNLNLKDVTRVESGIYNVSVTVKDLLGNESTPVSYSVKADFDAPTIEGISTEGIYKEHKGVVYVAGSLRVACNSRDTGSGVDKIELICNGEVVGAGENLLIKKNGEYSIKVTDRAGLFTTYRLQDLLGTGSSSVVLDTEAPTNTVTVNDKPVSSSWITDSAKLHVLFKDNFGLSSTLVTINGKEVKAKYDGDLTGEYEIDLKNVERAKDGLYKVQVQSKDMLGNKSNLEEFTVRADFNNPTPGNLSATGKFVEYKGIIFCDGGITISGKAEDIGSGIKSVELLKGTQVVSSKLPFVIGADGSYSVRITDKAGLVTTLAVNQMLGTKSNVIIIDNEVPVITRKEGFNPPVVKGQDNWYKEFPNFVYEITDANLRDVSIKLNGEDRLITESGSSVCKVDTSGLTGEVVMVARAVDCYGHESIDTYRYLVDQTAPKITKAFFSNDFKTKGGVLFFKDTPHLTVEGSDSGVGIKEFILKNMADGGTSGQANESSVKFKLGSGDYRVEVKDRLGNSTGDVELKSLMQIASNKVIVDSDKPKIKVEKPKGRVNNWYNQDVDFRVTLKDNQGLNSATVKVNGEVVDSFKTKDITTTSAEVHAKTEGIKPGKDGVYKVTVEVTDNAGNKEEWSDTFYLDKKAPKVDKFIFTGKGIQEGKTIKGSANRYGFYFEGKASCEIFVSDSAPSSGLKKLYVSFANDGGKGATVKEYSIIGGSVRVELPDNFKGMISAWATDNVGNRGAEAKPDSVITEDGNVFVNNTSIDIELPNTEYIAASGLPLYPDDIQVNATVRSDWAGIRHLEWGVGDKVLGSVDVDNKGNLSGDAGKVSKKDKNLVVNLLKDFAVTGNTNNMQVWVKVKDRTGQESKNSKTFSMDRDHPGISVSYSSTEEYNKETVVATITVRERNFDPARFIVSGENPGTLGNWSNEGDVWTNTLTFDGDGVYSFKLNCTDRAGNPAEEYVSGSYTVDKTAPVVSVSWDDSVSGAEGFYNKPRKATVTVVERNFNPNSIVLDTGGFDSGWTSNGDTHTNVVTFDGEGDFNLKVTGSDMAGNPVDAYDSGSFIIDTQAPTISIQGVENGVSYKQKAGFTVKISDTYIDPNNVKVTLTGKKNGEVKVEGGVNGSTGEYVLENFKEIAENDDIYTLKVEAKDKAGNSSEQQVIFSVNRFGSSYEFLETNLLNSYLRSAKDITITESNVDKLDISKIRVEVLRDGESVRVDKDDVKISEQEDADGKFKYTYEIDKRVFSKDGKYLIQIYSCSEEGTQYSSVSQEYAFILDTTPPEIIVSGVETDGKYYEYERDVAIDLRDLTGVEELTIKLNDKVIKPTKSKGIYSFKIQESNKSQTLLVEATDKAGNLSMVEVKNFTISSSTWVYLINQVWFKVGIGAAIMLLAALIALIIGNRRKSRRDEEEVLQEHADMVHSSSSSSSLGSADTKDEAEDLDKQ